MKRANHNEALTHLSMPERNIPVLIPSPATKGAGWFVWGVKSQAVRVVPADALRPFLDEKGRQGFEKQFGVVAEQERRHLLFLLGMADAIKKRDTQELRGVVRRYCEDIEDPEQGWIAERHTWMDVCQSPLRELGATLNHGIREVRLVVWWAKHEKRFAPGIYCKDISTALHALALSRIGESGSLAVCERCHSPFIRTRAAKEYCSHRCRVAAGMERYRERQKRKRRGKGVTRGPQKTR
jgi:hypothetical protein